MQWKDRKLPRPSWWPEPITEQDFRTFVPEGVELTEGFLFGGEDAAERRFGLLAVLLRNCGLEKAVRLADPVLWKEALDRWQLYGGFRFDEDPWSALEDED